MEMLTKALLSVLVLLGCIRHGDCSLSIAESDLALVLTDVQTGVTPLVSLFMNKNVTVTASGLFWSGYQTNASSSLFYKTIVDGKEMSSGDIELSDNSLELPLEVKLGEIYAHKSGPSTVEVELRVGDSVLKKTTKYATYHQWMATIPLLAMLVLAQRRVRSELTLFFGLFVGSCMIHGSIVKGFKEIFLTYIFSSASDMSTIYIYLFSIAVAGLMGLLHKSGGIVATTKFLSRFCHSSRLAQTIVLVMGLCLFLDAYTSAMVVGGVVTPLLQLFPISVEKIAFIVDTTAAPLTSLSPISSWVWFQSQFIEQEIEKIIEMVGSDDLTIPVDGFEVLRQSLKYQYYPILILILVVLTIATRRDIGPMLVSERSQRSCRRLPNSDRPGWTKLASIGSVAQPESHTPARSWNLIAPVTLLVVFLWTTYSTMTEQFPNSIPGEMLSAGVVCVMGVLFFSQIFFIIQRKEDGKLSNLLSDLCRGQKSGELSRGDDSSYDEVTVPRGTQNNRVPVDLGIDEELAPSSPARYGSPRHGTDGMRSLLSVDTGLFAVKRGVKKMKHKGADENIELVAPKNMGGLRNLSPRRLAKAFAKDGPFFGNQNAAVGVKPLVTSRPLVSIAEAIESFILGGAMIAPMLIIFTLAFAATEILTALGLDRCIASWVILEDVGPEKLPTIAFVCSTLLSLMLGSSWGAMTIMFRLLTAPAYIKSGGNPEIFYAVVGSIVSGAAAGEQASPIAPTTLLTCLSTGSRIRSHVLTQAPYIFVVFMISILFGTLPASMTDKYPVYAAYILGTAVLALFVGLCCTNILHPEGKYDFFTELYISRYGSKSLAAIKYFNIEECKLEKSGHDGLKQKNIPGPLDTESGSSDGLGRQPKKTSNESSVIKARKVPLQFLQGGRAHEKRSLAAKPTTQNRKPGAQETSAYAKKEEKEATVIERKEEDHHPGYPGERQAVVLNSLGSGAMEVAASTEQPPGTDPATNPNHEAPSRNILQNFLAPFMMVDDNDNEKDLDVDRQQTEPLEDAVSLSETGDVAPMPPTSPLRPHDEPTRITMPSPNQQQKQHQHVFIEQQGNIDIEDRSKNIGTFSHAVETRAVASNSLIAVSNDTTMAASKATDMNSTSSTTFRDRIGRRPGRHGNRTSFFDKAKDLVTRRPNNSDVSYSTRGDFGKDNSMIFDMGHHHREETLGHHLKQQHQDRHRRHHRHDPASPRSERTLDYVDGASTLDVTTNIGSEMAIESLQTVSTVSPRHRTTDRCDNFRY